jgi:hypothetical protein
MKRRIILKNGLGPATIFLVIDPPFVAERKTLFPNLDTAYEFARFMSEATDWPIIDRVDSLLVGQPRKASSGE